MFLKVGLSVDVAPQLVLQTCDVFDQELLGNWLWHIQHCGVTNSWAGQGLGNVRGQEKETDVDC
jgi:hypothetical protein